MTIPGTGFDVLLAASTLSVATAQPAAPVAVLPPGGNPLPVRVSALPTTLEFALELPPNTVQAVSNDAAKPQVQPGSVLPRALVSTAFNPIASRQPSTAAQPVTTLPSGERDDSPVASEAATPLIAGPAALAATTADVRQAVAAPIEPAARPQAQAPAATGPHRSPKAKPAGPGLIQTLAQHPAPAFAATAVRVASPPVPQVNAAPIQIIQAAANPIQTTPVPAQPAFSARVNAPHGSEAPGLNRAAARANPAAGFAPAPLASLDPAMPPMVDPAAAIAATAPLIAKRGPALSLAHQPAVMVTDLRIDPSPRAASPAAQITLDPALLRPVPFSDAIAQLTALPTEPAPAMSAYIGPARSTTDPAQPLDFAALIDRIENAREAGGNSPVHFALRHEDFGPVSLRFETDAGRISVDLSSPDPDFARAVAAAQPAASDAARAETGRSDSQRGESSARGQEAPSSNARDGNGSSRGSSDERGSRTPAGNQRTASSTKNSTHDQADLFA